MRSLFRLPTPLSAATPVETETMRRTAQLTVDAIAVNGLMGWSGRSRIGKTTTARWLAAQINAEYDPANDQTFRALFYETGEIPKNARYGQKQGIKSLYAQVYGVPLTDYVYRRTATEGLADLVVRGLVRNRIRLILIDEAGCLSVDAMRGLVLVSDSAENLDWRMSIVLIGMDDLPCKIASLPQLKGRLHNWCYFEEYSLEETKSLLGALHPHFASISAWSKAQHEEAEYIHQQIGGFPGEIVKFLRHVDARSKGLNRPINLTLFDAIRKWMLEDFDRAVADVQTNHARRSTPPSSATNRRAKAS